MALFWGATRLGAQDIMVSADVAPVVGGRVTLSTNAISATSYQWRHNGAALPGETRATLVLESLSRGMNGGYDAVVGQPDGSKTAHSYHLDVQPVVMADLFQVDPAFELKFEQEGAGSIQAILRLPDGKYLVGGDFTRLGDVARHFLARLHADGSVDASYVPPRLSGPVRALAAHTDGRIYVGGDFTFVDARASGRLVRLNPDLTVDTQFVVGEGFDGPLSALAVQADGRVIAGGVTGSYQRSTIRGVARLNPDGTRDGTFGFTNFLRGPPRVIVILADGKVVVAGGDSYDPLVRYSQTNGFVGRILPDGTPDVAWSGGSDFREFNNTVRRLIPQADGALVLAGGSNYGSALLMRLTAAGAVDNTFVVDAAVLSGGKAIDFLESTADGRLLVAGTVLPLTRLSAKGARESTVPALATLPIVSGRPSLMTAEPGGGKRFWGSYVISAGAKPLAGSTLLTADETSFGAASGIATRMAASVFEVQHTAANRILVRGSFTHVNDVPRTGLVRLESDGTVDMSFDAGARVPLIETGRFATRGDGAIMVHDGTSLIRLSPDGDVDPSFTPFTYAPRGLVVDHEGRVLVSNGAYGGAFGSTTNIRRLLANGSVDPAFSILSIDYSVLDFMMLADGRIRLNGLLRLRSDGTRESTDWPSGGGRVFRIDAYRAYVLGDSITRVGLSGVETFHTNNFSTPFTLLPLPGGKLLRTLDPPASFPVLGRRLDSGDLDSTFKVDGLDQITSEVRHMLLRDDGSLWLFGTGLVGHGGPRLGAMRLAPAKGAEIAMPPATATASLGGTARFSIGVAGSGPFTYQWYKNGVAIAGATSTTLTLDNLTLRDVAQYFVKVTGPFDGLTSAPVTLRGPNPAPTITAHPVSQLGYAGNPVTFTVGATGVAPLSYQWRRSGFPIRGATSAAFTIPHATRADAGIYDVLVYDGLTPATSNGVQLDVAPASYPNTLKEDTAASPRFEGPGGTTNAALPVGNGKFIVSGDFTRLNGVARPGLARVDASFNVDSSFQPPAIFSEISNGFVNDPAVAVTRALAVLPDGKVLVTRALPGAVAYPRNTLARLLPDGSLDPSFTASTEPYNIHDVALQPDGRLIVFSRNYSFPQSQRWIYRLEANGTLDPSYAPTGRANAIVVQADGKAVLALNNDSLINGVAKPGLARLNLDGSLDPTLALSGFKSAQTNSLALLPDGRLEVSGVFQTLGGEVSTRGIVGPNGAWENSPPAPTVNSAVATVGTVQIESWSGIKTAIPAAGGKLYVSGAFTRANGLLRNRLARLNADGSVDTGFVPAGAFTAVPEYLLEQPDGHVLLNFANQKMIRLQPDGGLDPTFAPTEAASGAMVLLRDGRIIVGGRYAYFTDGTRDTTFSRSTGGSIVVPLPDGDALLGGDTVPVKLRPDGTERVRRAAFSDLYKLSALAVQREDGKVLVGGAREYFGPNFSDTYSPNLKRLGTDLVFDPTFTLSAQIEPAIRWTTLFYAGPKKILIQEDGRILLNDAYGQRRLHANGALDTSFVPENVWRPRHDTLPIATTRFDMEVMLMLDDGRLVLGHDLTFNVGGMTRRGLVFLADAAGPKFGAPLADQRVATGAAASFSAPATAAGAISYQWLKDGVAIAGATAATYFIPSVGSGHAGSYSVIATSGGQSARSVGATLEVRPPAPTILAPPRDQVARADGSAIFSVQVTGAPPLRFQWHKSGAELPGATGAELILARLQADDAAAYSVVVTNDQGAVPSLAAQLIVLPAGPPATQALAAVQDGATTMVSVTNAFHYAGTLPAANWEVLLPPGWSLATSTGDEAARRPEIGATGLLTWSWPAGGTRPWDFSYTLLAAELQPGEKELAARVAFELGGGTHSYLAQPEPLRVRLRHSADVDRDRTLSLKELTRVIELYQSRRGTVRTGRYRVEPTTEDGFASEPSATSAPITRYHDADTDRNGQLDLRELVRMIDLYSSRDGSGRTGAYRVHSGTEDGFAPGP